jgi:four helix bundle protein
MNEFDVPIFQKSYDLYKQMHEYQKLIPKHDRYTVYSRAENCLLIVISNLFKASAIDKESKLTLLEVTSAELNLLRVFIRLLKDIKALDNTKYLSLQSEIDEIGRMLGGWIKSVKPSR